MSVERRYQRLNNMPRAYQVYCFDSKNKKYGMIISSNYNQQELEADLTSQIKDTVHGIEIVPMNDIDVKLWTDNIIRSPKFESLPMEQKRKFYYDFIW